MEMYMYLTRDNYDIIFLVAGTSGDKLEIQIVISKYRGMEQLVARRAHNPKVVGSSPAPATIIISICLVEISLKFPAAILLTN
jgi:hypothetical protein